MKLEIYLFLITIFLIYNTYHDGKYTKMLKLNMKYAKMASIGFGALSLYLFFKKNPHGSKSLLRDVSELIKYMPLDKNTSNLITPIINFTNDKESSNKYNQKNNTYISNKHYDSMDLEHIGNYYNNPCGGDNICSKRSNSGGNISNNNNYHSQNTQIKHKRSVSETKKKYIASSQDWRCGHCHKQLDFTYEVDHIQDLQHGGSNDVDNLVALCRNCHGKKTLSNYI